MILNGKKLITASLEAIAPGETLLDTLKVLNMTQKELAERMGRPLKLVNEIVKGKTALTPETAIQLERALGVEAAFWTNLEAGYRQALARCEAEEALESEIAAAKAYPYEEMAENGWIQKAESWLDRTRNLIAYFAVNSLRNVVERKLLEPVLYKISAKRKVDQFAIEAWLRKGVIDAQKITSQPFNRETLDQKAKEIRTLTKEKPEIFEPKIRECLAEAGVAFVMTKNLTNVPANGVSRWLGPDKALIQLSIYGKSADMFWFSLFHEIGHILHHGKRSLNIDAPGLAEAVLEAEANDFAKEILIPEVEYISFVSSCVNFSDGAVTKFAERIKIHPGIIVGRLQFEGRVPFHKMNHLKSRYTWIN